MLTSVVLPGRFSAYVEGELQHVKLMLLGTVDFRRSQVVARVRLPRPNVVLVSGMVAVLVLLRKG